MRKISIVENEEIELNRLKAALEEYFASNKIECNISCYNSAANFLKNDTHDDDILFLDILMPGMNGIELAKEIRKGNESVAIIFVTNLASYAIKGYEVNSFDFIIKPFNKLHLNNTMNKLMRYLDLFDNKNITLKSKSNVKVVRLASVSYIEIDSHLITYHFGDDEPFIVWGTLSEELKKLDDSFVRPNQYTLINIKHITSIDSSEIRIRDKCIFISRKYKKEVTNKIMEYYKKAV